ncbi:probable phosphoglycerate mutase [Gracilibacillus ureilyticus]|uniref:Probable phosphoglycerate mutase n=1 Tax=Gracilibacillus ureilyticus TaxID=531814 RepID=A0A1H9NCS7_9BACI|nr:histidine phosphatase family protein [Gracilibacillus ureilyticus]SER33621.1 probable phosphoglycerate mutase [Gracilibacillus ureilyticus]
MAIFFVRHGKDDESYRGGWSQRGLIAEGIEQSRKLGSYLAGKNDDFKITRIISSDLTRALETAECITDHLPLEIEHSEKWRETNNGVLAGMANEEANLKYPGLYFSSLAMDEKYPGGDSPNETYSRIKQVWEDICEEHKENEGENILIITHGGVINIVYHLLKGLEWTNKTSRFPVTYTSIHAVEFQNKSWCLTKENETNHL